MGMTGSDAQTIASILTGVGVWVGVGRGVGVGVGLAWVGKFVRVAMDVEVTTTCSKTKVGWHAKRIRARIRRTIFLSGYRMGTSQKEYNSI
jgi:hypothetical protein